MIDWEKISDMSLFYFSKQKAALNLSYKLLLLKSTEKDRLKLINQYSALLLVTLLLKQHEKLLLLPQEALILTHSFYNDQFSFGEPPEPWWPPVHSSLPGPSKLAREWAPRCLEGELPAFVPLLSQLVSKHLTLSWKLLCDRLGLLQFLEQHLLDFNSLQFAALCLLHQFRLSGSDGLTLYRLPPPAQIPWDWFLKSFSSWSICCSSRISRWRSWFAFSNLSSSF